MKSKLASLPGVSWQPAQSASKMSRASERVMSHWSGVLASNPIPAPPPAPGLLPPEPVGLVPAPVVEGPGAAPPEDDESSLVAVWLALSVPRAALSSSSCLRKHADAKRTHGTRRETRREVRE